MFNNLHKNQQWAFVDGVLCGALVAVLAIKAHKSAKERKALEKELAENEEFMRSHGH